MKTTEEKEKIKKIRDHLKEILPEKRYQHSVGTEKKARELAKQFGADEEKAALAGLLHDCAKSMKKEEILNYIIEKQIPVPDEAINSPAILHAYASEWIARQEFDINDEEILSAIRHHTVGNVNMSLLDKVVFVADKIEEHTRTMPHFDEIRKTLKETHDLDETIFVSLSETIKGLAAKKNYIHPHTIHWWNYFLKKKSELSL